MKIAILYNQLSENAAADEADVLDQVDLVRNALVELQHEVLSMEVSLNLKELHDQLLTAKVDAVFNLVESINNQGELIAFVPALLDVMKIPYTGSSYESTFVTSNKTVAKKIMRYHEIPTPSSILEKSLNEIKPASQYIIKPVWEDGSLYLDEASVVDGKTLREKAKELDFSRFFVEEYIDGREFNISILCSEKGPKVLNPAEIVFTNYEPGKPKIVGYTAKWNPDSFEYKNTVREFPNLKPDLHNLLNKICTDCWEAFKLKGYARVDIRLDAAGNPFVLEVNPNPCISPDSGFIAALHQTGIEVTRAISNIVNDLN